jgi:hypothetical protein
MSESNTETGARTSDPGSEHAARQRGSEDRDKQNLSRSPGETSDKTHQSDQAGTSEGTPQSDAKGAGAPSLADGSSDGVLSAKPRVVSGRKNGDATFEHTYRGIDKE